MEIFNFWHLIMVAFFVLGYVSIALESVIKVNKTAIALLMAVFCWAIYFIGLDPSLPSSIKELNFHLADESQVVFFLLGAMTLVELVDAHEGFRMISEFMRTQSKRKMLWISGFLTFFLSAVIDNLTATIVMISIIRKLVVKREDRLLLGATVVIAANAGGAWTPIGDVTTTMLWIQGRLSTAPLMAWLFLPSVACVLVSIFFQTFKMEGMFEPHSKQTIQSVPFGNKVLVLGFLALIMVPVLKALTGLPPFMGMLIGVGTLWLITDLAHHKYEERIHLRVPHILSKIDNPGVLFFLGILLAVDALESSDILVAIAKWLEVTIGNTAIVATAIGLFSAIIDNVPLVAGTLGMYSLQQYPMDSMLWQLIAYCAGTGGSILIIGSAAGIAFMGLEKVDFLWYLRRISISALFGYFAGILVYLIQIFIFK
jgi:NhaD family Na+/H+ antiporter